MQDSTVSKLKQSFKSNLQEMKEKDPNYFANRLGKDENILMDTKNNCIKIIVEGDAERLKVLTFLDSAEYQHLCNEDCTISFEDSALIIQGTLLALTHAADFLHTSNNYISEEKSTSLIRELNDHEVKKRQRQASQLKNNPRLTAIPSYYSDSFFSPVPSTTKHQSSPIIVVQGVQYDEIDDHRPLF